MSSNRREVLLAAGGIAAASTMVGSGHALADKKAPAHARFVTDIPGIGTFDALSVQWGAGLGVGSPTGGGGGREASAPSLSEVTITRLASSLSPKLLESLLKGKSLDVVTITQVVGGRTVTTFVLEDVIISGFSMSGAGGDLHLNESLSLNFVKFTLAVGANDIGYDLATGRTF